MEMYFKRKLFKQGNSLVMTFPKEIMEILKLKEGTKVKMSIEKGYLIIKKSRGR